MKLRYFLKENKKIYTLKKTNYDEETKEAHYKFLKLKDAPKSNPLIVRKN